ncbi:hypothetical protein CKQ90_06535, partial [Klebsiella pneumoniae]
DTHELFSAVETLSHMRPLRGEKLMIVSNGAAPARWRWMSFGCETVSWRLSAWYAAGAGYP